MQQSGTCSGFTSVELFRAQHFFLYVCALIPGACYVIFDTWCLLC